MTCVRIPFRRSPARVALIDPAVAADSAVAEVAPHPDEEHMRLLFQGLSRGLQELQTQQRQSLQELQHVALELATTAASWLTQAVIDREQLRPDQLIAEAVQQLAADGQINIRLNPLDHDLLTQLQEYDAAVPLPADVQFHRDPALERGSCTAETSRMTLVSDLETRLATVRQAWLENLDDAQTERRAAGRDGWQPGRIPDRRETA